MWRDPMDPLITAAARALAAGDPLGARTGSPCTIAVREDVDESVAFPAQTGEYGDRQLACGREPVIYVLRGSKGVRDLGADKSGSVKSRVKAAYPRI